MEKKEKGSVYDPLKTRTIILSSSIDDKIAQRIIEEMLMLEKKNHQPIQMIINSPGGQVNSGMAIYDTMQLIQSPVYTVVAGIAASMATILAIGGEQNNCTITPNSRFMIHQPLIHGVIGKASDLQITAEEIKKTKEQIAEIYIKKTKKTKATIMKALDQDRWFSAQETLDYGLMDAITTKLIL